MVKFNFLAHFPEVFHRSLSDKKSPQVTSQYASRSLQCWHLDAIHSCSYFQFFQSLYQSFFDCTERTDYNWYHHPYIFQFLTRSTYLSLGSPSSNFPLCSALKFSGFCLLSLGLVVWPRLSDLFVYQNPREVLLDGYRVVHISLVMIKFKFLALFPVDHLPHPVVYIILFFLCSIIIIIKFSFIFSVSPRSSPGIYSLLGWGKFVIIYSLMYLFILLSLFVVIFSFIFVLQGGTIKLSSSRKQHYSFILKLLLKKSIQVSWLCSRADIYSM